MIQASIRSAFPGFLSPSLPPPPPEGMRVEQEKRTGVREEGEKQGVQKALVEATSWRVKLKIYYMVSIPFGKHSKRQPSLNLNSSFRSESSCSQLNDLVYGYSGNLVLVAPKLLSAVRC